MCSRSAGAQLVCAGVPGEQPDAAAVDVVQLDAHDLEPSVASTRSITASE